MGATAKDRSLFMKGFNLSTQGNYEDPTYLGFKIVFDFGGLPVDEFGMPPSPLFKDTSYTFDEATFLGTNPFGQAAYDKLKTDNTIAYYSAQTYLEERETGFNETTTLTDGANGVINGIKNIFGIDETPKLGGIAAKIGGALDSGRSGGKRSDMLKQFKTLLQNINRDSPWFFQSIENLDELAVVAREDYNAASPDSFSAQRTAGKVLTINCLESLNLRISALADLYRTATFDAEYMRELLPRNLRYFKMFIFVTDIRNFNKTARLSGSAAAVKAVQDVSSLIGSNMNPGTTDTINNIIGGINKVYPGGSAPGGSFGSFVGNLAQQSGFTSEYDKLVAQSDQAGIKPVLMYECSQCEFDFDDTYPAPSLLDMGTQTATPIEQSFKIHVGRVKVKNQYPNIRLDGLPMVLSDGWDSNRSSVQKLPRLGEGFGLDLLGVGQDLLTNFVSNAIGDMITEGVANLTSKVTGQPIQTFENVYDFGTAQAQLSDDVNIYGKEPQDGGLGGPPERVYKEPTGDAYLNVPGTDLGVPDRVYPGIKDDVYPDVPGTDLGVPDRVYPIIKDDVYPNVPGTDLGVPDRVYPGIKDDVYPDDETEPVDLKDDVYPDVESKPANLKDDVYPDMESKPANLKDDVYPGTVKESSTLKESAVYPTASETIQTNVSEDVYPEVGGETKPILSEDVYREIPKESSTTISEDVYPDTSDVTQTNLGEDVYTDVPGKDLGGIQREYAKPDGDLYKEVPGKDLGVRNVGEGRTYEKPDGNVYENKQRPTKIDTLGRSYPTTSGNFNDNLNQATLGNAKGKNKYNMSLGDKNPDENKFNE